MNCHLCGNKFVIRTDPKACDYIFVSGVEKRIDEFETKEPEVKDPEVKEVPEVKPKLDPHTFYKLENVTLDKEKPEFDLPRLEKLLELKEANKNDY